jgi:hypothetical protein
MPMTAILVALLAVTPPVTKAPEPVLQTAVYVEVGLGSPLGVLGIESVTRVAPWLELSAGLGMGLDAAESGVSPSLGNVLQWSVMPRLLLGNGLGGFTLGVGMSGGNSGDWDSNFLCFYDSCPTTHALDYVVWANVEVGAEVWMPFGLAGRLFGGWAHGWCVSSSCLSDLTTNMPYIGAGIGYAF